MLRELSIENLAVIEKASIAFDDKLNVFTGETGAGKSILIGGINAILGGRVSKDIVRAGTEKAVVTGLFDDLPESVRTKLSDNGFAVDDELLLQRDIHADGKSTARINGRATTVAILRDIASELIDIHGQHDNRLLMDGDNQREILDSYGKNSGLLSEYATAFKEFSALSRKIKEVSRKKTESLEKAELLRERLEELDRYNFSADEEETVKQKIEELRNAEYISENLYNAQTAISGDDDTDGAYSMLEHCKNSVSSLSETIPELDKLAERISDMLVELEDIREEIVQRIPDEDEDTAGMLGVLEERLSVILRLQRKYGTDLAQILENSEKWRNELYEIDNGDDIIEELTEKKKSGSGKKASHRKGESFGNLTDKSRELFEELRSVRYSLAKKKGIPPYMVASDRTLHEMCVLVPFEKEELLEVHGMGLKKYEQYGAVFLDKIQEVTAGDKKGYGISEDADGTDAVQNQNPLDIGPFGSVEN